MKTTQNYIRQIKRHLSANGSLLLPLALKWRLLYMAVGLFTLLILPGLAGQRVSAATITLEVPSSLSLTLQPDGAFHSQSSATPVKIASDAFAGYDFSIMSSTGSNALTNGAYSIKSIDGSKENSAFELNTWGWQYSKNNAEPGTTFLPGPTTGTQIDHTDAPVEGETEYTITIGAKVDSSIPYSTYSGSFTLVVTANPVPYVITYNQNTEDEVSDLPATDSGQSATGEVALSAKEPQRDKFRFLGWCLSAAKKVEDIDTCDKEKTYKPGDEYTLKSKGENIEFFAMWTSNSQVMQNWGGCKDLERYKQISLVDIRDNRLYYVAKQADDNCWMTENLDFNFDANHIYTPIDTDVRDDWQPLVSTYTTGNPTWSSWGDESAYGQIHPQSYDPGDICWTGERTWSKDNDPNVFETDAIECESHDESHWHIGNYYNYSAVVAQNDTSAMSEDKQFYDTSICPAGWQIPNYEGDKSYEELYNASNAAGQTMQSGYIGTQTEGQTTKIESTIHAYPFYFPYTGINRGGVYFNFGYRNHYRSNAVENGTRAYLMFFDSNGSLHVHGGGGRFDGFSARCVSRDRSMQNVAEWEDSVKEGETVTAFDERDGSIYTVSRLADGKLWMTQDLRIGSNDNETILTSADTDTEDESFILPQGTQNAGIETDATGDSGWHVKQFNTAHIWVGDTSGYYSWYAATLGEGTTEKTSGDVSKSICPKNWRLPTSDELTAIANNYTAATIQQAPANFKRVGICDHDGCPKGPDSWGIWWSSTAGSDAYAYYLRLEGTHSLKVFLDRYDSKGSGLLVRCVAR